MRFSRFAYRKFMYGGALNTRAQTVGPFFRMTDALRKSSRRMFIHINAKNTSNSHTLLWVHTFCTSHERLQARLLQQPAPRPPPLQSAKRAQRNTQRSFTVPRTGTKFRKNISTYVPYIGAKSIFLMWTEKTFDLASPTWLMFLYRFDLQLRILLLTLPSYSGRPYRSALLKNTTKSNDRMTFSQSLSLGAVVFRSSRREFIQYSGCSLFSSAWYSETWRYSARDVTCLRILVPVSYRRCFLYKLNNW